VFIPVHVQVNFSHHPADFHRLASSVAYPCTVSLVWYRPTVNFLHVF